MKITKAQRRQVWRQFGWGAGPLNGRSWVWMYAIALNKHRDGSFGWWWYR